MALLSVMSCKNLALSLCKQAGKAEGDQRRILLSDLNWAIQEIRDSGMVHEASDFWQDLEETAILHGVELKY